MESTTTNGTRSNRREAIAGIVAVGAAAALTTRANAAARVRVREKPAEPEALGHWPYYGPYNPAPGRACVLMNEGVRIDAFEMEPGSKLEALYLVIGKGRRLAYRPDIDDVTRATVELIVLEHIGKRLGHEGIAFVRANDGRLGVYHADELGTILNA